MAKFSVTCKQQCCTVPELRDSLEVLSSHQPCELESCWDQRSSSKKALAWARGQESSSASGWWDGGGRGQWGQQQGPHLVPERGQCLASSPAQNTSVQKCEPTADSATELVRAASPGLRCQFWGGCDRINPKPAFSAAVE